MDVYICNFDVCNDVGYRTLIDGPLCWNVCLFLSQCSCVCVFVFFVVLLLFVVCRIVS